MAITVIYIVYICLVFKKKLYDGKNVEWPDYICHFEQVAHWNGWSKQEMATQLSMSLRGIAQRAFSKITSDVLFHYESLKFALSQRFCPPERETTFRCEFCNRRRKREESVSDFGYALKRLATRAFPSIPFDARESLIIEQYISGLGDADLKRHVQFSHPSSLDNAISLALEFEASEGSQIVPRKPKSEDISSVCPMIKTEEVDESVHPSNAIFGKLLEGINEIHNSMKAILQSKRRILDIIVQDLGIRSVNKHNVFIAEGRVI